LASPTRISGGFFLRGFDIPTPHDFDPPSAADRVEYTSKFAEWNITGIKILYVILKTQVKRGFYTRTFSDSAPPEEPEIGKKRPFGTSSRLWARCFAGGVWPS
jgi:hypothetical protein